MTSISAHSYQVKIIGKSSPGHNTRLREKMIKTLSHAYVDPEKVIDRRFMSSDKIFLLLKDNVIKGFSTYTFLDLLVNGQVQPTVYLGIMAAGPDIRNKGTILKVMEVMKSDIGDEEKKRGTRFIVWGTTASPSSLAIFRKYFNTVSPDDNNRLRPEHQLVEKAMKACLLQDKPDPGYPPLVIKGLVPNSIYSPAENQRINSLKSHHRYDIFKEFGIEEILGDRLIMIGTL
ncbi:MAG: hypothetical protein NTU44_14100 [Bacteroidetes bacterium]|nr:hypothetical protein [Bacteroidota bacterium]